jgi:Transglycosylase SLT domain
LIGLMAVVIRFAFIWLCCAAFASPVFADIWGFIDEKGVGHFSATKVDERYELFSKEVHASEAPASQLGSDPNSRCAQQLGSDPNCLPQTLASSRLSPKLAAFFESSTTLKIVRPHIQVAAKQHNLDVELLQALIAAESGFNLTAISPKGALGLMQLMPNTAARYGVPLDKKPHTGSTQQQKLFDAQTNIAAGSRYLRDLLNLYSGKLDLALAAYNAGEGAVQRAGNKIPNYPETQNYVKTVTQIYTALKPPAPQPSPVLAPEPKKAASPDPLRPIRGRGNGLPISFLVPPERGADAKHGGKTVVAPQNLFGSEAPSPLSALLTSPRSGGTHTAHTEITT